MTTTQDHPPQPRRSSSSPIRPDRHAVTAPQPRSPQLDLSDADVIRDLTRRCV